MDIAILSDIHGNYIALDKCINYALSKNINTFIFLGDYVGELAYPDKTMQRIYDLSTKYECYFIRGNKEEYWINYKKSGLKWLDNDSTTGSLLYTYNHLTEKDIQFFEGLPISSCITLGNMPKIMACHGSPYKSNEKLLPNNDRTIEIMNEINIPIILCGHTHIQNKIEYKGRIVLNAGAVGVPLHSEGKSQFMILHQINNNWEEEFVSLEYDVEKVIQDLYISGMDKHAPYWCKVTENLLRNGNISHGTVLAKAMSLCNDEMGNCIWPNVPEKYWKQAVEQIM